MRRAVQFPFVLLLFFLGAGFAVGPLSLLMAGIPGILGFPTPKQYLILLQNQYELRPTGGFMGSYAIVTLDRGRIKRLEVQDIYEPDGRVATHVDPPAPIQEAFSLGTWRLRDANWDPDWPTSAKTIAWFFEKAGEGPFDGIFTANLSVFQDFLAAIGPVELPDYQETISADNLWERAQAHAQLGFFPGSKQKRDFLAELTQAVRARASRSSVWEYRRYLLLFFNILQKKEVQVYFSDPGPERLATRLGWGGGLAAGSCPSWSTTCMPESLMIVEANLGVNKANCCLDRRAELVVAARGQALVHDVKIIYTNRSQQSQAGSAWGGPYRAWVRVYAPTPEVVQGFWIDVPQGETRTYQLEYQTPAPKRFSLWSLTVQKQSGMPPFPLESSFPWEKKVRKLSVDKDTVISSFHW